MTSALLTDLGSPRKNRWLQTVLLMAFLAVLFAPPVAFADDIYTRNHFARFACLAILALSVDLIWGYTGLLSLGQGLYFGIGAYAVGYSLALQKAATAQDLPFVAAHDMAMPGFMAVMGKLTAVPVWIRPLINIWVALAVAVLLPTLIAALFGWLTFRLRIKGVFFALITQVLILAMYQLVVKYLEFTGGFVGMQGLPWLNLFGVYQFKDSADLYYLIAAVLAISFLGCYWLVNSKFGMVLTGIRDNETRVLAMGYNTALCKTFVFAIAAAMAGMAGALYAAANRTIGPEFFKVDFSIDAVIFVAVGGRGTLFGAVLGAFLVRYVSTTISDDHPETWRFILGGLFIAVVLFLPYGIMGALRTLPNTIRTWSRKRSPEPQPLESDLPAAP
ncbi:MAG TPA: urea ABC transporter permease subunit UrtC [Gemmataceae bacterium]|nr:urea ABC transporter permease subunit UrtC [Gemmataceae bacterium]